MVQIVLDTNVLLDLIVFKDPSMNCISSQLENKNIDIIINKNCKQEFIKVLNYKNLREFFPKIGEHIKIIESVTKEVRLKSTNHISYSSLPKCKDTDDQKFLELALTSNAKFLLYRTSSSTLSI